LFATCKITDEQEKMNWAISYVDSQTRADWTGFAEFAATVPSWSDFKDRLRKEYPQLITGEQGSVKALTRICGSYRPISLGEEERLLEFKRRFTIEANKCLKDPPIISNRELVDMFVDTLDATFKETLDNRLSVTGGRRTDKHGTQIPAGDLREEDPYDWTVVVETAVKLASGKTLQRSKDSRSSPRASTATTGRQVSTTGSGGVKREVSEFTSTITETITHELGLIAAQMKDSMVVHEKQMKALVESFKNTGPSRNPGQSAGPPPPKRLICFYCGKLGHGWNFCQARDEDVKAGRIRIEENKAYFADRTPIPQGDGPIRERVLERFGLNDNIVASNAYIQMPLELPQGMLEIPQTADGEYSIFVNKVRDHRDVQINKQVHLIEEKEHALQELKQRLNVLEQLVATKEATNQSRNPPVARVQKMAPVETREVPTAMSELANQIAQLQAQLQAHNAVAESREQYLETRAAKKASGF
jgi:uncharacterized coiled-coil protein SlyX